MEMAKMRVVCPIFLVSRECHCSVKQSSQMLTTEMTLAWRPGPHICGKHGVCIAGRQVDANSPRFDDASERGMQRDLKRPEARRFGRSIPPAPSLLVFNWLSLTVHNIGCRWTGVGVNDDNGLLLVAPQSQRNAMYKNYIIRPQTRTSIDKCCASQL